MRLLGGTIAWRSTKQDTVTTSSTEAELLALASAAKEVMFTERVLNGLGLRFDRLTVMQEDNRQTIRLLCDETLKVGTRLRHVDINHHWLRDEVQKERLLIERRGHRILLRRSPGDGSAEQPHNIALCAFPIFQIVCE